jgi:hypothetical protein
MRIERCEKSVESVALQGAMRESSRIIQDILESGLPDKFRQEVTQRCDQIQTKIRDKLKWQLVTVCQKVERLELQVGKDAILHVKTGLN